MAITGIDPSSYYSDYYTKASNASSDALENTLGKVGNNATEEELMSACREFEAYFIEQIYKGMEKTIMKADDDESSGSYMDYFGDMQIQEYAKLASEQGDGIGLAQQLYQQMKRNYGL
ncbi:MAG: rod-binding protein [Lachnospiraceae bacterium]|nr:rod-binding protein [Lachnospiraceae bacterium]MDE6626815.1 rod-binding protein [Lachnospiraceae bacterium]